MSGKRSPGNTLPHNLRFLLTFGTLMATGPFAVTMFLPSLPTLERDFGAHAAQVQLTVAMYFFGMALGQLPYGALSDRWGRRPPMLLGMVIFTLASLAATLANSIEMLIVARFLQALGGCAVMVVVRAIIRDLFPPLEGARVFSTLLLVMGVAPIVAPLLGGWIMLGLGSWRAIFAALTLYGAAGALILWLAFPETRRPGAVPVPPPHNTEPLPLQFRMLFRDRYFYGNALAGSFSQAAMIAYLAGSPFVLIEYLGVPPQNYGWLFAINAAGLIGGSQLNRLLLPRWGVQGVLKRVGILAAVSGALMLLLAVTESGGLWGIMATMFVCVFTQGFMLPNTSVAALVNQGSRAGFASGVLGTLQFASGALASVVLGLAQPKNAVPLAAIVCAVTVLALAARQFIVPRSEVRQVPGIP